MKNDDRDGIQELLSGKRYGYVTSDSEEIRKVAEEHGLEIETFPSYAVAQVVVAVPKQVIDVVPKESLDIVPTLLNPAMQLYENIKNLSIAKALIFLKGVDTPEVDILYGLLFGYKPCDIKYYVETRDFNVPPHPLENVIFEKMGDWPATLAEQHVMCEECAKQYLGVSGNVAEFANQIRIFRRSAQVELLQLANDLRPVAEVFFTPKEMNRLEDALKILKENGFSFVGMKYDEDITEYCVSKDVRLAQEMVDIQSHTPIDHKRFGELMGFPAGSIEAFVKDNINDYLSHDEILKTLGFKNHFFPLQLSKSHFSESIKYLRDSYKVLVEQAPHIIEEGLSSDENVQEYIKKVARFIYSNN